MGSSKEQYPEFFDTFRPDRCFEELRIGDGFLEYLTEKIPKQVVIRNGVGKHWPVEVVETNDGVFFQKGWSRIVLDNSLQGGEVMFFKYDGHSTFNILITNSSKSGKQPVGTLGDKVVVEEEEEEEEEAENSSKRRGRGKNCSFTGYHPRNLEKGIHQFFPSDNPFFVTEFRSNGRNELFMPYNICADAGVIFDDKIKVVDPKGRQFVGRIVKRKDGRQKIPLFWRELCKLNQVSKDDHVICELLPSKTGLCQVMKVQIINAINAQSAT